MDKEKRNIQWYLDRGLVVPGSGEEVALRQRERDRLRMEAEIAKASETSPVFMRLWETVKEREKVTSQEPKGRLEGGTFGKTHGEAKAISRLEAETNVLTANEKSPVIGKLTRT